MFQRGRSHAPMLAGCRWIRCLLAIFSACASEVTCPAAERLRAEASAFLQASVESPVEWTAWGDEAFARAKREQKPVFVCVGAFTNELSAAMRRQTFARRETAEMLNANFVCVLVDRDEHPEVAAMFQAYVNQIKQTAGWPLNVWLTPELQPFEGAAYLPPSEEWGKPGFLKVAGQAKQSWTTDPAGCRVRAAEAVDQLRSFQGERAPATVAAAELKTKIATAAAAWMARFDSANGGFGDPPRNPEPELLRFLLARGPAERDAACLTLRRMTHSALRDPLDGGFFRGASDGAWNVPVLQKTLLDQARLALTLLEAAKVAGAGDADDFRAAARGALDYALARLALPDGSFAAGEDATAEEFAGYYAWTAAEIDALLGEESAVFKVAHGVESTGNISAEIDVAGQFSGKNLLRSQSAGESSSRHLLRAARERRAAPPRDRRATAGAHGMLLAALSRASVQLREPRYAAAAERLFGLIEKDFLTGSTREVRRFRASVLPGAPVDYAALALGCAEFGKTTDRTGATSLAKALISKLDERFFDGRRGRYAAVPATLPLGIFFRPLALADPWGAESLALLAGENLGAARRDGLSAALAASGVEGDLLPGDVMLALSLVP